MLLLFLLLAAADSVPGLPADTAQVMVISPLVDAEVDAAERRLYHLFPGYAGFSSAVFLRLPDSTCAVDIFTERGQTARRYPVSVERCGRIGRYIDDFEAVVAELAYLPNGESIYNDLWEGMDSGQERGRAPARGAPDQPKWTDRVVNCVTGAACGLGVGSAIGAATAIEFTETRQESLLRTTCQGDRYWYHYSVDYYELDRGRYAALAGSGSAVGGAAGWLTGQASDNRRATAANVRRNLAGYDFFGDPISEADVRARMSLGHRTGWTFLGAASGFVVGTGVGLALTSIVRGLVLRPTAWDSIIIKNDGVSLDIPLIAMAVAGLVKGAHLGHSRGLQLDWRDALDDVRRERLRLQR